LATQDQDESPIPPEPPDAEAEKVALRQQISSLELRLAQAEAELATARPGVSRVDAQAALLLAFTCLLALIPPVLIFLDRWLLNQRVRELFQTWWCRANLLCRSAYPSYFMVIFPCLVLCVPLVWILIRRLPESWLLLRLTLPARPPSAPLSAAQTRASRLLFAAAGIGIALVVARAVVEHHVPGWELALAYAAYLLAWVLREAPVAAVWAKLRRRQGPLTAILLGEVALLVALASRYGQYRFHWITAVLLLLAAANLWRYRKMIHPIVWIATLALALYATNMNAWWLSAIGDEYSFWAYAREIAEKQRLSFIGANLFNGQAVYGAHPYFSSLIQSVFMRLFDSDGFGWRISNACLCAAAVLLLYLFTRTFVTRRTALMAALFLAISHYIISFGKIGYNNLQALFAEALVLAAAAWAVRTRRPLAFAVLGAGIGFCFYVYPAALYMVPLPVLLLLLYLPPVSRAAIGRWAVMVVSAIIPIIPLFLQPGYWQAKIAGTLFYTPEITQTGLSTTVHIGSNLIYAALSHLYVPQESHFVVVSYVDPLTTALVWLGLACFLRLVFRERFAAFCLIGYAVLLFLVGASHDRQFPTATRMFLLLPWYALFAAAGLTWLVAELRSIGLLYGNGRGLVALVFVIALGLNLYQAYPLARDRMGGLQSLETLFLRTVQWAQRGEESARKTYVFVTDPSWSSVGIQMIPEVYPVRAKIAEVVISGPSLPESAAPLIADRNTLVIIKPWLDPTWQAALEAPLRALGKEPCPIRTTTGDARFTLWHAPNDGWLCR
jgi:4-amino-4-deoxy-L-arabinose transferase-like glycosyltransferase